MYKSNEFSNCSHLQVHIRREHIEDIMATTQWIQGQFGPYLKIQKGDRWINITKFSWDKILKSLNTIDDYIKRGEGIFHINETDEIEIKDYLSKRYVCMRQTRQSNDKEYVNRMNFDVETWNEMTVQKVPDQKKRKRNQNSKATKKCKKTITQYGHPQDGSIQWYFTEAGAKRLAPDDILLMTKEMDAPTVEEVTDRVARYLLMLEISANMTSTCYGCSVDHPSQIEHMEGCMMDWVLAVDQHFDIAWSSVTTDIKDKVTKVMDVLGLTSSKDIPDMNSSVLKEKLTSSDLTSDYMSLFIEIF